MPTSDMSRYTAPSYSERTPYANLETSRASAHTGSSQPGNVVTVTTGHTGDPQSTTHHFGVQSHGKGPQNWNGQDTPFVNANNGKTAVVKPESSKQWDGPDKPKRDTVFLSARDAMPEAYADAYADAYEDAFAFHKRNLYLESIYARDLEEINGLEM